MAAVRIRSGTGYVHSWNVRVLDVCYDIVDSTVVAASLQSFYTDHHVERPL